MGQSYKQYLPDYVVKWYRDEGEDKSATKMVVLTALAAMIAVVISVIMQEEGIFFVAWGVVTLVAVYVILLARHAKKEHGYAVLWVDEQMKLYEIKPESFDRGRCLQILAALAHLLDASPTTEDAKERKHQLRQFHGLIELLYGEIYASDLNHSVSVLRREVPIDVLAQSTSQIPDILRRRVGHIAQPAA